MYSEEHRAEEVDDEMKERPMDVRTGIQRRSRRRHAVVVERIERTVVDIVTQLGDASARPDL